MQRPRLAGLAAVERFRRAGEALGRAAVDLAAGARRFVDHHAGATPPRREPRRRGSPRDRRRRSARGSSGHLQLVRASAAAGALRSRMPSAAAASNRPAAAAPPPARPSNPGRRPSGRSPPRASGPNSASRRARRRQQDRGQHRVALERASAPRRRRWKATGARAVSASRTSRPAFIPPPRRGGRGAAARGSARRSSAKAASTAFGTARPSMRRKISVLVKKRQWIGRRGEDRRSAGHRPRRRPLRLVALALGAEVEVRRAPGLASPRAARSVAASSTAPSRQDHAVIAAAAASTET